MIILKNAAFFEESFLKKSYIGVFKRKLRITDFNHSAILRI